MALLLTLDPRCDRWLSTAITCTVTSAAPVRILAVAGAIASPSVTVSATSNQGEDADPGNNTITLTWD